MKRYSKYILEAINRGIQLALDDFEDDQLNEPITPKKDIIRNDNLLRHTIIGLVDLGLPSGTLWAKYNLGVSINSTNPNKGLVGNFYAWGETEPRKEFTIEKYKFGDDVIESGSTKYNSEDKLFKLEPSDDAVSIYYNTSCFHIPTIEQANELLEYTDVYFINKEDQFEYENMPEYTIDGAYYRGWLFVSKINKNYIFFPNTGIYRGKHLDFDDYPASGVWLSETTESRGKPSLNTCAESIGFWLGSPNTTKLVRLYGNYKYYGLQIRPVYNK